MPQRILRYLAASYLLAYLGAWLMPAVIFALPFAASAADILVESTIQENTANTQLNDFEPATANTDTFNTSPSDTSSPPDTPSEQVINTADIVNILPQTTIENGGVEQADSEETITTLNREQVKEKIESLLPSVTLTPYPNPRASNIPSLTPALHVPPPRPLPPRSPVSLFTQTLTGSNSPDFTSHEPVQFTLELNATEKTILIEPVHDDIPEITRQVEVTQAQPNSSPPDDPSFAPSPVLQTPTPTPSLAPEPAVSPPPAPDLPTPEPDSLVFYWIHSFFGTAEARAAKPLSEVASSAITTIVRDSENNEVNLPVEVTDEHGKTIVRIPEPKQLLHPGKYTLEVTATVHG